MTSIGATSGVSTATRSTGTDYTDFDTKTMVEAKLQSRTARISRMTDEAKVNSAKISAYTDLRSKLAALDTAAMALRAAPDSGGKTLEVFRARAAYLTSSAGGDAGTQLSASVKAGTTLGNHTISVNRIAKLNILAASAQSSKSVALGWAGAFTVGVEGGARSKIAITADMSLADVAATINAETIASKVTATVMKVSENSYQLVLTATETGKAISLADVPGSSLLADSSKLGMIDGAGKVNAGAVLQAAQTAEVTVDGVTLTRSSNDIADALDGTTLHLYSVSPAGTSVNLEVSHDLNAVKKAVAAFVDAYNALRDIVIANRATKSDGTANADALLFGDMNLRAIATATQDILSSSAGGVSLAELGIGLDDQNKLKIDDTVLSNALLNHFDSVETVFSYKTTVSSGDLTLLRHPSSGFGFDLNVTVDAAGNLTRADIGGDTTMFTVSGGSIVGKAGTAYEGLTLLYTGKTAKTISVKLTQGMADRMYDVVEKFANTDSGTLSTELSVLSSGNDDLDKKIAALTASTQSYANYLYTLYGKMAARISEAQTTIKLFKALLKSGLD